MEKIAPVSQVRLLIDRRFLPLYVVQFFGALNDNLFKTSLVVMLAYGAMETGGMQPAVLVSLAAAVFILPFVLVSPFAGQLAERYSKVRLTFWIKVAEIMIVLLGVGALVWASPVLSLVVLGLLGVQSALFGPCKYGLLPEILAERELVAGNGLVSSGTYIAILFGTILGAVFVTGAYGVYVVSALLLLCAIIGFIAALFLPKTVIADLDFRVRFNPLSQLVQGVSLLRAQGARVVGGVLAIAWFYFIAAMFHAQFPNFAKESLNVDTNVLAFFMVVFSLGIGVGSVLNHKILGGQVRVSWVPFAALGIALFSADLYLASRAFPVVEGGVLLSLSGFLTMMDGWRITFDLLFLSVMGGLYIVPLRALVQKLIAVQVRGRVLAMSALMEASAILISALLAAFLLGQGFAVVDLFLILSILTFLSVFLLLRLAPEMYTARIVMNLFKGLL